jgi:hypothetical protein
MGRDFWLQAESHRTRFDNAIFGDRYNFDPGLSFFKYLEAL